MRNDQDSVVLITGGFSTLGRAIATRLARREIPIVLHYHNRPEGTRKSVMRNLLESCGSPSVTEVQADLTQPDSTTTLISRVRDLAGAPIYGLVNNAGVFFRRILDRTDWQDWAKLFAVNVFSPAELTRSAAASGARRVVNITDIAAVRGWPSHSAYCASKAALEAFSRAAAAELAPICQVNSVAPGIITLPPEVSTREAVVCRQIPAGRLGDPEEVAQVVEFLLLDAPDYLTGESITIDGGRTAR
jgi:NAD(P)-dependent dehydrogenase (short-subunit alcohol dehydrogenase family)